MSLPGCIGFTAFDRDPISEVIQWATSSKVSHGFVAENQGGRIIEALWQGVVARDIRKYYVPGAKVTVYEPMNDKKARVEEGLLAVREMIGKRYGFLQLIGVGMTIFLRSLGLKVKNRLTKGIISSEVLYVYFEIVDRDIVIGLDRQTVSHDDMWRRVRNSPNWSNVTARYGRS